MKKQLILVGGAMGVGKSAVCRELLRQLTPGVWLDGDWCWNMNPFVVSEENKRMVLSNITHLLRAYLNNSSYRYVLFCWVMDQPLLFEAVLGPLRDIPFTLHSFSLVCTEQALRERLEPASSWHTAFPPSGRPTSSREASGGCLPTPHCRHANWM